MASTKNPDGPNLTFDALTWRALIAVRDSKNPDGPKLIFDAPAWRAFTRRTKNSDHDLS